MLLYLKLLRVSGLALLVCLGNSLILCAQDESKTLPKPSLITEKVVQFIETKKLISKEQSDWDAEKQILQDLTAIRTREAEQMNEIIELAKERVSSVENEANQLKAESNQRKQWRLNFERRVTEMEKALLPQLGYLPKPVVKKVDDAVKRLKNKEDQGELQGRFRDVVAILNECVAFNNQLQTFTEIRSIDGEKLEVEVLYMGMNQAWYVDRTGKRAGIGTPGIDGWTWQSDPRMAKQIRQAIDIQTKRATPAFAKLPLTNGNGGGE